MCLACRAMLVALYAQHDDNPLTPSYSENNGFREPGREMGEMEMEV